MLVSSFQVTKTATLIDMVPKEAQLTISDLDLSVRARHCLHGAKIHFVDDLVKQTREELLKIPNLGLKTLVEIQTALAALGLTIKQPPADVGALETPLQDEHKSIFAQEESTSGNLEEELLKVASQRGDRNAEVFMVRYGLAGSPPATLQETGDRFRLTRERVRQICDKIEVSIRRRRPLVPLLDRAISVIRENSPHDTEYIEAKLLDAGITHARISLDGIAEVARLIFGRLPFVITNVGSHRLVLDTESQTCSKEAFENLPKKINETARRLISHWGVSTILDTANQVAAKYSEYSGYVVDERVVRSILILRDDFRWLDEKGGWFWLSGVPRNRILNQIDKILSVANRIHISELRSGVARNYRMEGFSPPKRVLLALCEQLLHCRIENEFVFAKPPLDRNHVLVGTERTMAEILTRFGPVLSREEFEKHCLESGMNRSTFYVYLGYSPIVARYARGVYGLRGAEIEAGLVEALVPKAGRKERRVSDFGWKDGRCWIIYRISKAMIDSGVIGLPSALRKYINGPYSLKSERGEEVGRFVAKQSSAWGLGPFFRRSGGDPGDYLLLNFDLRRRDVFITIGDSSAIDEALPE